MNLEQTEALIDDEILAMMAVGSQREALHLLMRHVSGRTRRPLSGTPVNEPDAPLHHFRLAVCFAMLGMEPDALDWCLEAEKLSRARRDGALLFQVRVLRLWLMVDGRRIASVLESGANLLRAVNLPDEIRALVVAGLMLTAARSGDFVSAERLAESSTSFQHRPGLGSTLLDLVIADTRFREALLELPQFEGSLAKRSHAFEVGTSTLEFADVLLTSANRFQQIAIKAVRWPLIADLATVSGTAARLLSEQLRGKRPSLAVIERHVAKLSSLGLAPLLRHVRFLLAVLVLHQGRGATAEGWLANGAPLGRFIDRADPDELLLLSFARAEGLDFAGAYRLFRSYVALATDHAAQCSDIRVVLTDKLTDAARGVAPGAMALRAPPRDYTERILQPGQVLHLLGRTAALPDIGISHQVAAMLERTTAAVREMVEDDLSRPLLVKDIVAALGISRRTLEIRVRRSSGTSVKRYIASIRLQHARHLLLAVEVLTTDAVKRIALQVGFPTYRTFSTAYRRSFGMVPTRIRKAYPIVSSI